MIYRANKIERITRTANTLTTRELPKTVLRGLWLNLSLSHTYVSTVPTLLGLLKSISSISVIINGRDQLIKLPFYYLYFQNFFDFSYTPYSSLYTTAAGSGTSTVSVYLPFAFTRTIKPIDGLLDLRKAQTATLEINWAGDLMSTETVTGGYLDINSIEYTDVPADAKFGRHEYAYITQAMTATGEQELKIPVLGLNQYRRLMLFMFDSSSVLSDAEIDNLSLDARSFNYLNYQSAYLQRMNMAAYSIAKQTGIYFLDLISDGRLSERIDARTKSELILTVNALLATGTADLILEKAIFVT